MTNCPLCCRGRVLPGPELEDTSWSVSCHRICDCGVALFGNTVTWAHPQACAHTAMWEQSAPTLRVRIKPHRSRLCTLYGIHFRVHTAVSHPWHSQHTEKCSPKRPNTPPPCTAPCPRAPSPIPPPRAQGPGAELGPPCSTRKPGACILPSTLPGPPLAAQASLGMGRTLTFPAAQCCPAAKTSPLVSWAAQR